MKKLLLIFFYLIAGCENPTRISGNFEGEFSAISVGDSKRDVLYTAHSEPLAVESFNLAGFTIERDEWRDLHSVFAVYFASTPLTEARVVAKSQQKAQSILSL